MIYDNGKSVLCCVIVDITSAKILEQELKRVKNVMKSF